MGRPQTVFVKRGKKLCSTCKRLLSIKAFSPDTQNVCRLSSRCLPCRNNSTINWRIRFPEKALQATKNWQKRNKTRRDVKHKIWMDENRASELHRVNQRRIKSFVPLTIACIKRIETIYEKAQWWRQWFDVVVDHIIPIARGGKHHPSNLQIIYRSENAKKHARLDYKPKVVFV
jgi:5-methylcytosine-specific restriction endonuclease McrA